MSFETENNECKRDSNFFFQGASLQPRRPSMLVIVFDSREKVLRNCFWEVFNLFLFFRMNLVLFSVSVSVLSRLLSWNICYQLYFFLIKPSDKSILLFRFRGIVYVYVCIKISRLYATTCQLVWDSSSASLKLFLKIYLNNIYLTKKQHNKLHLFNLKDTNLNFHSITCWQRYGYLRTIQSRFKCMLVCVPVNVCVNVFLYFDYVFLLLGSISSGFVCIQKETYTHTYTQDNCAVHTVESRRS